MTNISFCEEIDSDFDYEILYLYSINYLGINTTSISEKGISKINNLEKKINIYNSLAKVKIAFLCVESIYVIFLVVTFIFFYDHWDGLHLIFILLFGLIFILVYASIIIVSLHINKEYISNFIYKINIDLQKVKKDFNWNTIMLVYQLLFLLISLLFCFSSTYLYLEE